MSTGAVTSVRFFLTAESRPSGDHGLSVSSFIAPHESLPAESPFGWPLARSSARSPRLLTKFIATRRVFCFCRFSRSPCLLLERSSFQPSRSQQPASVGNQHVAARRTSSSQPRRAAQGSRTCRISGGLPTTRGHGGRVPRPSQVLKNPRNSNGRWGPTHQASFQDCSRRAPNPSLQRTRYARR